jgi:predicted secreted hydrolase
MRRRVLALLALAWAALAAHAFDPVVPGKALEFPRDYGSHPGHRIEWWYVTGHLESASGPLGFQVTFFRVRNPDAESVPGRFSPRQILFAHAALADAQRGRFLYDERIGRVLPDLVDARVGDTVVRLDDWMLARESGGYRTRVAASAFALDLVLTPTQPPLLQGDRGFSRKGPLPEQASYYYSEPQLRVEGKVHAKGEVREVRGVAWLDHEWSSEMLASEASGWDWLGANLEDGAALTAFRIRAKDGRVLWATATYRAPGGDPVAFTREAVQFTVRRTWKSPRTGTTYPVAMDVRVADRTYQLEPLLEDQELDARASTGTLYWEGAVRITGRDGLKGRGYLELTGYAERVPF